MAKAIFFAAFSKDQQDGDAKDIVERIRSKKRVRESVKISMAPPKPRNKSGDLSQVSNSRMRSLLQGGGIQEEEEEEDVYE